MDDLKKIDDRLQVIEAEVKDTKKLVRWAYYLLGAILTAVIIAAF